MCLFLFMCVNVYSHMHVYVRMQLLVAIHARKSICIDGWTDIYMCVCVCVCSA
jgi:hypothetical protein